MAREYTITDTREITPLYVDIKKAVEQGATSFKEVKQMTKVGKACGKCKEKALVYHRK